MIVVIKVETHIITPVGPLPSAAGILHELRMRTHAFDATVLFPIWLRVLMSSGGPPKNNNNHDNNKDIDNVNHDDDNNNNDSTNDHDL